MSLEYDITGVKRLFEDDFKGADDDELMGRGIDTSKLSMEAFYDLGLDTCWPKNSGQTDEVVDIVFDAYVSKWREMYGDDLTDDQADELYAMIYDGVF